MDVELRKVNEDVVGRVGESWKMLKDAIGDWIEDNCARLIGCTMRPRMTKKVVNW